MCQKYPSVEGERRKEGGWEEGRERKERKKGGWVGRREGASLKHPCDLAHQTAELTYTGSQLFNHYSSIVLQPLPASVHLCTVGAGGDPPPSPPIQHLPEVYSIFTSSISHTILAVSAVSQA